MRVNTKIKHKTEKAVFQDPHQELQSINKKIVEISELPFVVGFSDEERNKKIKALFAKKRAIMQALNI